MTQENNNLEKELFEMVYQWGRVGVVTDFTCNTFQDKLSEIKDSTLQSYRDEIEMKNLDGSMEVSTNPTPMPNKFIEKNEIRKKISEILVKWNMPTRQIAINEILALFTSYRDEILKVIPENLIGRTEIIEKINQL